MNLESFKLFYSIANTRNFSQAAKENHMSQSTVSSHIKHLEEYLDTRLFDRSTKKVDLTHSGQLLYPKVEKLFSLMNEIYNEMESSKDMLSGHLKLGSSLTIGEYILPFHIASYKSHYPFVNVSLKISNSEHIIEQLGRHEFNLGFIESSVPYRHVKMQPFREDRLIVVASPHSKWLNAADITKEELFALPFINREKGSGTRQVMEEYLSRDGFDFEQLSVVMELEHIESIKSAVEADMGISILSEAAVARELRLGILKEINVKGLELKRLFYMVYVEEGLQRTSRKMLELFEKKGLLLNAPTKKGCQTWKN
ncbi:selenium metabolism-associated LysR family transcriptional regulator [Bacillus sp. 1P06AnD]|uniref:selenium metabolism-associated LysR family transcriptional regulator n=1 Tax=Bacillus sp. 1P06AnD TaxID=3132208 RepID=UPI0039A0B28F